MTVPWPWPSDYDTRTSTVGIVVHHTAVLSNWRLIDVYHRSKGWVGIGYNIGIDGDGSVTVFGQLSDWRAHTYGYNGTTIGLAFMCEDMPSEVQLRAGRAVVAWLHQLYGPLPLFRHSQLVQTACPGNWDIHELEATVTDEQKAEIVGHLDVMWGVSNILAQALHTDLAADLKERIIAIKQVLGV